MSEAGQQIKQTELSEPIWERQPGEPSDWFRRFASYRNQVGKRSLLAVYRQELERKGSKKPSPKSLPSAWKKAKIRWHWDDRCAAWDVHQQEVDDLLWRERHAEWRENCWKDYQLLRSKALAMLRIPIVDTAVAQSESGVSTTLIKAVDDWGKFIVPLKMMQIAVRMGELAIGDINAAFALLVAAGFEIRDPTTNQSEENLRDD